MRIFKYIKNLLNPPRQALIIVGVEYDSYQIHNAIKMGKKYYTAFFIDEDPWNHRNHIDEGQLRYPVELRALCQNYEVKAVICSNNKDKDKMENIKDRDNRELVSKLLVISPEDIKYQSEIDRLISIKLDST